MYFLRLPRLMQRKFIGVKIEFAVAQRSTVIDELILEALIRFNELHVGDRGRYRS